MRGVHKEERLLSESWANLSITSTMMKCLTDVLGGSSAGQVKVPATPTDCRCWFEE
jgi:hypothetical protein